MIAGKVDMRSHTNERGIALPLVLFVLVILGIIIAGTFYVARLEQKTGDNAVAGTQAAAVAEAGVDSVMANWSSAVFNSMAVAAETTMPTISMGGNASYTTTLRRLNPTIFMVRADGRQTFPGGGLAGRRQVSKLVRLDIPMINMNAAITTRTGLTVSGSSDISGIDSIPSSMAGICPPAGPTVPGIRDSSGNVNTSGACSGASCIVGNPQILTDPTVSTNSFTQFGNTSFAQLAARANFTVSGTINSIAPATVGSPAVCNTGLTTNWGAPLAPASPCGSYFPIIYAPGDVRLTGGAGQGILLVACDLDVSGGVEFYGPVIVMGTIRSTGTGGHIYGGVMSSNANLGTILVSGNSVVNYSSCTIARALQGISTAGPLGERSWAQLY
jgi:hypothetical protein